MSRGEFADLVISILEKGFTTPDKRLDRREVFVAMESVIGAFIAQRKFDVSDFLTVFNVTVESDTTRNLKYAVLSDLPMSLPNNQGIHQVSPVQNEKIHFINTSAGDVFIYSNLEAGNLLGQTSYWIEGDRIYFKSIPAQYTTLLVKIIASLTSGEENQSLAIPSEFQGMLLQQVLQLFGVQYQGEPNSTNDRV